MSEKSRKVNRLYNGSQHHAIAAGARIYGFRGLASSCYFFI